MFVLPQNDLNLQQMPEINKREMSLLRFEMVAHQQPVCIHGSLVDWCTTHLLLYLQDGLVDGMSKGTKFVTCLQ